MEICDATAAHLDALTALYNDVVEHTTAIWNDHPVDRADRAAWLAQRHRDGFPVLVCLGDSAENGPVGEVLGYATYGAFRPQDGFRDAVEDSIYVRSDQQGRGIGRSLLEALIARARAQGVRVMIAAIDAGNDGSVRLHEKLGFEHRGTLPQVGMKFSRRLDLALLQLTLADHTVPAGATGSAAAAERAANPESTSGPVGSR